MVTKIGNGKPGKYGVKVTIDIEKAMPLVYEFKGKKYLTFDVDLLKEPDKYGKTHTVSVWTPDNQSAPQSSGQSSGTLYPDSYDNAPLPNEAPVSFNDDDIPF